MRKGCAHLIGDGHERSVAIFILKNTQVCEPRRIKRNNSKCNVVEPTCHKEIEDSRFASVEKGLLLG